MLYEVITNNVPIGEHIITVRNTIGCGETSVTIMLMDYPLYFTPNGDGYHDIWNITGIQNQPEAQIYIFDRYGKLLKQLIPSGSGCVITSYSIHYTKLYDRRQNFVVQSPNEIIICNTHSCIYNRRCCNYS